MIEKIYAFIEDEYEYGIRISTFTKPYNCPGLGGWKYDEHYNEFWTRIKGNNEKLQIALDNNYGHVVITLEHNKIIKIEEQE